ncbi:MAG: extracellular solute-binding protein [Chloroflexota bacterium]|nr:MAG: extracellular solute-binding protein [Chloroflexota bacterium]
MYNRSKTLSLLSILVAFALVLGACAQPTAQVVTQDVEVKETVIVEQTTVVQEVVEVEKLITPTPAPEGPVTIQFWHTYNVEVETPFLQDTLIPEFEAAHPNIKVEQVQVPYDQFRRKLLTSMAGGTAPDLIRADIIWVPEFADMGALAALDEVMPDFAEFQEAVFPGPLSTNYLNGHYYGLPLDTNTRVLVYNKDMFAAAGIETPPATIEEFLADCEKIKALGENKYCFADGGTYAWAVNPWIWSFGGDVTDPDISAASGYLDGANTKAAYEFLKNLVDKGYMHPGILGGGVDAWGGFANDEIAMLLEGPWFPPIFDGQFPDKPYGMALKPAGEGGSISVVGGEDIVMFQQSQHKEAAAEFIRFMLSEEVQLKWATAGQMPVIASVVDTDEIKNHAFFGIFLEQLKTAKARTPHPNWSKIEEAYNQAGSAFLAGELTFEEALGETAKLVDGLLGGQ